MKRLISILLLFVFLNVVAFPPITHGILKSTASSGITTLSNGIKALFAHWQSAKEAPVVADGTAIDSVQDLSGNNRTITSTGAGRPGYYSTRCNGYPAWYFDGTNDFFNIPSYTLRGAICVLNIDSTRLSFALLEGFYGSRSTASPNSYWGTDGGRGLYDFSPSGNATYIDAYKITTANNFFIPSGKAFRVIAFMTSAGVTDATGYQVGSDRKFGTRWMKGNYAEIIGLNAVPTKKQLDTINSYLWTKYNLTTPYLFIQDGNSIGLGVGPYIRDSLGFADYRNFSVGGQTTVQRQSAAATAVDTCYGFPYGTKQVCYILEGTNDLLTYGYGADSCYAHLMTYANSRIAVGWKVVVSTVLSRTPTGARAGYETSRDSLNTLLNNVTQTNSLKIVDFGQDANLGATNAYSNATYFSDGIHPTVTGYKLIAKYVSAVIKSFTY